MAVTSHRGAIVWAVTAYTAEQPFRVLAPDGTETRYGNAADLARAVRGGTMAGEFELAVTAKLRPVVLLQDRPRGRFADFAAVRLVRMAKFAPAERDAIRAGQEESVIHLGQDPAKYGLKQEYAVLASSLHRIHRSAIAGRPIGALDPADLRLVSERLAAAADLDLSNLIVRRASQFLRRAERGGLER